MTKADLKRIENALEEERLDDVTVEECVAYAAAMMGQPIERVEARLAQMRGEDLFLDI